MIHFVVMVSSTSSCGVVMALNVGVCCLELE